MPVNFIATLQTGLDTTVGTFATLGSFEIGILFDDFSSSGRQHIFGPSQQMSTTGDEEAVELPSEGASSSPRGMNRPF